MKNAALRYIVSRTFRTFRTFRIPHPASHIPNRVPRIPDLLSRHLAGDASDLRCKTR